MPVRPRDSQLGVILGAVGLHVVTAWLRSELSFGTHEWEPGCWVLTQPVALGGEHAAQATGPYLPAGTEVEVLRSHASGDHELQVVFAIRAPLLEPCAHDRPQPSFGLTLLPESTGAFSR
ncbi:MAG: hypothetical protein H6739_37070 [Alphaproteobacteria bacterium]|nr:hypothetical protein [Alphaproteobacteria bacterium]